MQWEANDNKRRLETRGHVAKWVDGTQDGSGVASVRPWAGGGAGGDAPAWLKYLGGKSRAIT